MNNWVVYIGVGVPRNLCEDSLEYLVSEEAGPFGWVPTIGPNESWIMVSEEGGMYHGVPFYEATRQVIYAPVVGVWDGCIEPEWGWPLAWSGTDDDWPLPTSGCVRHF